MQKLVPAVAAVDHLLLGVSDLDLGIDWAEPRTGIRAAAGGIHPGVGTRNALLPLGTARYLEIIAPDPLQSDYRFPVDVRTLTEPRLITFAVATSDIENMATIARGAGHTVVGPTRGSRVTSSGATLRWKTLRVLNRFGSGVIEPVPFFIQWDHDTPHPASNAPAGCELESLEFQHPHPGDLQDFLAALGVDAKVSEATVARIIATLKTPRGSVELSRTTCGGSTRKTRLETPSRETIWLSVCRNWRERHVGA